MRMKRRRKDRGRARGLVGHDLVSSDGETYWADIPFRTANGERERERAGAGW